MHYVLYFQVTLLEESWSELFLLCAIQWCLPFEKPSLFAVAGQFKCDSCDEVDTKRNSNFKPFFAIDTEYGFQEVVSSESIALIHHLSQMYARYKRFNVNPAEFACMKAIVLFKSGKPNSFLGSDFLNNDHVYKIFFVVRFFPQFFQLSSDFLCFLLSNFLSVILYFLSFRHFRGRCRII